VTTHELNALNSRLRDAAADCMMLTVQVRGAALGEGFATTSGCMPTVYLLLCCILAARESCMWWLMSDVWLCMYRLQWAASNDLLCGGLPEWLGLAAISWQ
jgi:hypothetical protein